MVDPAHDGSAAFLDVLQHARELNNIVDMPRLERMLFIYRSWIASASAYGVAGGFSLTEDELACVLEYPENPQHLQYLMHTFQATGPSPQKRVDLLTFLAACTCLARGALEQKATFLFRLVDFDTEDEIVEDELGMVIALCNDGLRRIGMLVTALSDVDARAIAWEAFESVGIEESGKMSVALFVQWLVSHPRPAALFDRIQYVYDRSSLFLVSSITTRLHAALEQQQKALQEDPFHIYNSAHFNDPASSQTANIHVIVGPIVGPVTQTDVRLLIEVDCATALRCFAFEIGNNSVQRGDPCSPRRHDKIVSFQVEAFVPCVVTIGDLVPGKTYQFRFLDICKRDREKCVAIATTARLPVPQETELLASSEQPSPSSYWAIRVVNHDGGISPRDSLDFYHKLNKDRPEDGGQDATRLCIHFGAIIQLHRSTVATMKRLLRDPSQTDRVAKMLQDHFRTCLARRELFHLLRVDSNLVITSSRRLVADESDRSMVNSKEMDVTTQLLKLTQTTWRLYIGALWGLEESGDVRGVQLIHSGSRCLLVLLGWKYDQHKERAENDEDTEIQTALTTLPPLTRDVICITLQPLLPPPPTPAAPVETSGLVLSPVVQRIIEWKRQDLSRNVCLVAPHPTSGFHVKLSVRNTTISIPQIVCGPLGGCAAEEQQTTSSMASYPSEYHALVTLAMMKATSTPHWVAITCDPMEPASRPSSQASSSRPSSQASSSRPVSRSYIRSSQSDRSTQPLAQLICTIRPCEDDDGGVRMLVGPILGTVTSTTATMILEGDRNGSVAVQLTDRLKGETIIQIVKTRRHHPVRSFITALTPARVYTISIKNQVVGVLQTPSEVPASTRILVVGDDAFCDHALASSRRTLVPGNATSLMGSILCHLAPQDGTVSYDLTIRLGASVGLRHDLLGGYEMIRTHSHTSRTSDNGEGDANDPLDAMIRRCYHAQAGTPDARALLARGGGNVVANIGLCRSLLQQGAPVELLCAVKRVVHEYGHNQSENASRSLLLDKDLLYQLSEQVTMVMLDTTDCMTTTTTEQSQRSTFVSWPECLLTKRQIDAITLALSTSSPQQQRPFTKRSRQILILGDAPFVWPYSIRGTTDNSKRHQQIDNIAKIAADPWSHYPLDLQALLRMLFAAIQTDPLLRITLLCCGPFASRVVITDKITKRRIEQLTLGSVSNATTVSSETHGPRYTPERALIVLGDNFTITADAPPSLTTSPRQYCLLDVVPHPLGAECTHTFYSAGKPDASIVLGPVIGRVTSRTARILIEVDRPVLKAICVVSSTTAAAAQHTVSSSECELEAFAPTIFKLEGLHPGTRYKIHFEGGIVAETNVFNVETPPLISLSAEWIVLSRNNLTKLLPPRGDDNQQAQHSHFQWWPRILAPGSRFYNAQSASQVAMHNGDTLGESVDLQDPSFNPWHHVQGFGLSEPLRPPQLCIHLGGQVDMSTAFPLEELRCLVTQLCDASASESHKSQLYALVKCRLQDVYRVTWGVTPMRKILASASNAMLLHEETDLFFSATRLHELLQNDPDQQATPSDDQVTQVAIRFRAIAFELWQLYQNQLWVDVNESDLDNSRRNSSKFASSMTLGLCRLVVLNGSDDLRDLMSNSSGSSSSSSSGAAKPPPLQVVPLSLPTATTTAEPVAAQLPLFSAATWKTLDDAMELGATSTTDTKQSKKSKQRKIDGSSFCAIQQLVVCVPLDVVDLVTKYPAIRSEIVKLLEILFQWKLAHRDQRQVSLICNCESTCTSMTLVITDEKSNERLSLQRIASISEPKPMETSDAKSPQKKNAKSAKNKTTTTTGAGVKGYFSKRFTYQSVPMVTVAVGVAPAKEPSGSSSSKSLVPVSSSMCRSYAKFQFLSDYRRGFLTENVLYFPSIAQSKIVLGPVIGRIVLQEHSPDVAESTNMGDLHHHQHHHQERKVTCSVPILIELNAPARVTCVLVDSMINTETRVTNELQGGVPHVFCLTGLTPLRRYVVFFEGVSNGESRRGSFHTPPPHRATLNLVALSSNFPTQMDQEKDSLWVGLVERAQLPWCGIDAVVHLGGQVPLHEAAVECYQYASRELSTEILHGDATAIQAKREREIRAKIWKRFQQEYHLCWNLPMVRELLAHASQWFVKGKADTVPFIGYESPVVLENDPAARLVLDIANEVVQKYQIQLMTALDQDGDEEKANVPVVGIGGQSVTPGYTSGEKGTKATEDTKSQDTAAQGSALTEESSTVTDPPPVVDGVPDVKPEGDEQEDTTGVQATGGALYWQHGEMAVFMCDPRSANDSREEEGITCNGRLSRALSRQENAFLGEQQWKYLESALRKKRTLLLLVCLELPLILTDATYVDKLRDDLRAGNTSATPGNTSTSTWKLYDHTHIAQHYVWCKRQLEQLLLLLFKWKAKRPGREIIFLSGGMRIGIDSFVQDKESKLKIRNLTVGPITATPEPFMFPLTGVACATFAGGLKDDHFTFRHTLVEKKNYLVLQATVEVDTKAKAIDKSASVIADFVSEIDPEALERQHPVEQFRRLPLWWSQYIPMGKWVFWDDTITLKSETDDQMLLLREYLWTDKGFSGSLDVFYEKYQFAETARLEDLRSRHLQHVDLQANFKRVLHELWKHVIPESKKRQMAYFLDPFVLEMLLDHVAPGFRKTGLVSGNAIELAFFCRVIREFVFDACLLRLTIQIQQQDELDAIQRSIEKDRLDKERLEQEKAALDALAAEEANKMAELMRSDPQQYAAIMLAKEADMKREREAKHQAKLDRKKAERLAEIEEEQAIAKEQKKLNKIAERDASEYERRQKLLDIRIRKLEEKRAQRAAQKKAAAEKEAQADKEAAQ